MKPYWLYITTVLVVFFAVHAKLTENTHKEELDRYKEELCKYYVARSAALYLAGYRVDPDQRLSWFDVSESTARGWESVIVGVKSFEGDLLPSSISAYRLPRKFLSYDVYRVYRSNPTGTDSFFKIGFDDQFNFVTFWGFRDPISAVGEYAVYLGTRDDISFESGDLPLNDKDKVDQFIGDWIQLTQYGMQPGYFKILSNDYEVTNNVVEGTCQTAEFYQADPLFGGDKVRYIEWSYRISSIGLSHLELLSQREDEDKSVIFGS